MKKITYWTKERQGEKKAIQSKNKNKVLKEVNEKGTVRRKNMPTPSTLPVNSFQQVFVFAGEDDGATPTRLGEVGKVRRTEGDR